jgi:hypothetical protein
MASLLGFPRVFGGVLGGVGAGNSGGLTYAQRAIAVMGTANVAQYLILDELSGTTAADASGNGRTGAYSNVTLNSVDFVKGGRAGSWNGTTSFANTYSASMAGAFNPLLGTINMWVRVSAVGIWSDGITRLFLRLGADASNNLIQLDKLGSSGAIRQLYIAGGTVDNGGDTSTPSTTDWFMLTFTWNKTTENRVRGYFNGVLAAEAGTLGTWSGSLNSAQCTIGSGSTTPANVWSGFFRDYMLATTEATGAQVAALYAG